MTTSSSGRRGAALVRRRAREREILDATRALFDARGVRDAQIEDVARAVGVNRAIIYRHFSGKEELFALTLVGYLDDLEARLGAVSTRIGPRKRVKALTEAFVDFGLEHPAFVDCAQTLMRRPGPGAPGGDLRERAVPARPRHRLVPAHVTDALEAGVASGDFEIADVHLLANTLYASGLGALQLARVGMLVKEAAPGVPVVAPVSPGQVKDYLVATRSPRPTADRSQNSARSAKAAQTSHVRDRSAAPVALLCDRQRFEDR
jgi:AcrR family transcriptional regulator